MFGQNNNQDDNQQIPDQSIDGALGSDAPASDAVATPAEATTDVTADTAAPATVEPTDVPASDPAAWQHPGLPLDPEHAAAVEAVAAPSTDTSAPVADTPAGEPGDLIDIKQQALQQLSPLVTHLEQSPEERFKTLMMMIQASDDQSLVKDAYAAANDIEDEKAKAQALLDIVNEINYFTTQHSA